MTRFSPSQPTHVARVSVVIPNWNTLEHLPECLASLAEQTFKDFEIVVVDNASSDGSVAYLRQQWPDVRVIALATNTGFPGAVNAGIRASDAPYVVLLNNDTAAEPGWLEVLVAAMDAHHEFAFASSKLVRFDDRTLIDSAGHAFSITRSSGINLGQGESVGTFTERAWVFGAPAAAAIYRRSLIDDIGAFDEDFFFLHEDVEFDVRANVAGYRCMLVPDAVVYHKRGGSFEVNPEIDVLGIRNRLWVATNTFPAGALVLWAVSNLVRAVWLVPLRLVNVVRRPTGSDPNQRVPWSDVRVSALARAIADGVRNARRKRRALAGVRRLSSIELIRRMIATRTPRPISSTPS